MQIDHETPGGWLIGRLCQVVRHMKGTGEWQDNLLFSRNSEGLKSVLSYD